MRPLEEPIIPVVGMKLMFVNDANGRNNDYEMGSLWKIVSINTSHIFINEIENPDPNHVEAHYTRILDREGFAWWHFFDVVIDNPEVIDIDLTI